MVHKEPLEEYPSGKKQSLKITSDERRQYGAFGVLSLAVAALTGILLLSRGTITRPYRGIIYGHPAGFFQAFLGNIPPLLVIALLAVVGIASLHFLYSRGWFEISTMTRTWRGTIVAAAIATLFAVEAALVESTNIVRLPADINVPLPWSLLFYPIIGYVVEIAFHALPLALSLVVLGPLFKKLNTNRLAWLCILLVASLEPIFQMSAGLPGKPFSWSQAYVGLHVFGINVFQLYIFRRYGFAAMYSFRVVYYMYWHIIWGYLRLQWLF